MRHRLKFPRHSRRCAQHADRALLHPFPLCLQHVTADDGDGGARVCRSACVENRSPPAVVVTERFPGEREPFSVCRRTLQPDGRMCIDVMKRTRALALPPSHIPRPRSDPETLLTDSDVRLSQNGSGRQIRRNASYRWTPGLIQFSRTSLGPYVARRTRWQRGIPTSMCYHRGPRQDRGRSAGGTYGNTAHGHGSEGGGGRKGGRSADQSAEATR